MMQKRDLVAGYSISPVIKGGWQLSQGHSLYPSGNEHDSISDILAFVEAGITTLDFGDIYTGVEELIGKSITQLRSIYGDSAREKVQLHTKYVPNEGSLSNFDKSNIEQIVDRSLRRLGVDQVDLVQFHWWKYEEERYLEALEELFRLKRVGKIRHVGVTNFDVTRLQEMVEANLAPASIQLQYSVLDRRPESGMLEYCSHNGIGVLCYGTVAGGFLSERYLGISEPLEMETRSSVKYKLIIDEFGGWELFQELLARLAQIAQSHGSDIGTISSHYILSRPAVSGVIIGARNISHLASNVSIPQIELTQEQVDWLEEILERAKGPSGPVYDLERYSDKHRNIMKTNLN